MLWLGANGKGSDRTLLNLMYLFRLECLHEVLEETITVYCTYDEFYLCIYLMKNI